MNSFATDLLLVLAGNAAIATLLALAAAVAERKQRPDLAHGLCGLALLKLITPPLWRLRVPVAAADQAAPIEPLSRDELLQLALASDAPAALTPAATVPIAAPWPWASVALGAVALGGTLLLLLAARRALAFRRLLQLAPVADAGLAARLRALCAHLGITPPPQLRVVTARVSPMLCLHRGRATLVLPQGLLAQTGAAQVDTLLAHELVHLRRRDHWLRVVELLALATSWWLPTTWWLRRALRRAEEQCVDAQVLRALPEHGRAYADALLQTIDFLAGRRAMPPVACGAGAFHDLRTRLTTIMSDSHKPILSRRARVAFLALAGIALPIAPSMAQDEVRAADNPREAKLRAQVDAAAKEVAALRDELQALRAELQANRGPTATRRNPLQRADSTETRAESLDTKPARNREAADQALAHAHEVAAKALEAARPHLRAAQEDGALAKEYLAKVHDEVKAAAAKAKDMAHKHGADAARHAEQALAQAHEAVRQAHEHAAHAKAQADEEVARAKQENDFFLGATRADSAPKRDDAARARRDAVVEKLRADSARAEGRTENTGDRDDEIQQLRRELRAMQRKLEALQQATQARGQGTTSSSSGR